VLNTLRPSFVAVLLALLAGTLGLAACGSDDSEDAKKVISETFSGDKKVTSGKVELTLSFKAEGSAQLGNQPINLKLSGPFQSQGPKQLPKFDFDLTLGLGAGRNFAAGAVSTGDKGFLKFQNQAYSVPDNVFAQFRQGYERSQQQDGSKQNPSFSSLGIDPGNWLKDPKDEGEADVAGTETNHVSSDVDVSKLLDDVNKILSRAGQLGVSQAQQLPNQLSAQQRKAVEDAIEEATLDVYSGKDDKTLRRLTVRLKFKVPENRRQDAGGLSGGDLTFDLVLADLNQPQTINAPANPKSFDELTQALRETLGGLAALGGSGSSGGSSGSAGSSGGTGATGGDTRAQEYAKCIAEAGGDIAKAQQCQALLSGG
jgi:hypothetical protein